MTTFDDRERGFEAKFARDEEMSFRITARRNRLVGTWAAGLMGLTPEETDAYAKAVVQADFEESGDEDVVRKLLGDLLSANVEMDESRVRAALHDATVEARRQLIGIVCGDLDYGSQFPVAGLRGFECALPGTRERLAGQRAGVQNGERKPR